MEWGKMEDSSMSIDRKELGSFGQKLGEELKRKGSTLATAESCTGGNIAACITGIAGSSAYFKGGVVAYANEVKQNLLHVSASTLERYGAVSEQTVREMVQGAIEMLSSDYAVATSGIAGPDGGTPEKPVGTIWIAAGSKNKIITWKQEVDSGREQNALRAVRNAFRLLEELLQMKQK